MQDSALEWVFEDSEDATSTVKLTAAITANNSLAIKAIVLAGGAIVRMPNFLIEQEMAGGKLISLFSDLETNLKGIYAVVSKREYIPAKTRAFIEFMGEKVAGWQLPDQLFISS